MKKIYFPNLDGLRFLAFFSIFFHHSIFSMYLDSEGIDIWIKYLIKPAGLGVPFFFCLSGFLITYLLLVERTSFGKIDIKRFYIRRILRIWPLYYLVILFGFFIFPFLKNFILNESYIETAALWKYVLFLSNFDQIEKGLPYAPGLGVTWSIAIEEQFYLFWPLLLTLVKPRFYFSACLILFLFSILCTSYFHVPNIHALGSLKDLSLGGALAVAAYNKVPFFERTTRISRLLIMFVYLLGVMHIYLFSLYGIGYRFLITIFMVFVIFEQCYCTNSFFKMESFKKISYLGTLTYGFYLLHTISNFISHNFFKILTNQTNNPPYPYLQTILSLLLTFLLGFLSYEYFEKYFLRLKKKFSMLDK